jgi:hypothetical protein
MSKNKDFYCIDCKTSKYVVLKKNEEGKFFVLCEKCKSKWMI